MLNISILRQEKSQRHCVTARFHVASQIQGQTIQRAHTHTHTHTSLGHSAHCSKMNSSSNIHQPGRAEAASSGFPGWSLSHFKSFLSVAIIRVTIITNLCWSNPNLSMSHQSGCFWLIWVFLERICPVLKQTLFSYFRRKWCNATNSSNHHQCLSGKMANCLNDFNLIPVRRPIKSSFPSVFTAAWIIGLI